MEKKAQYVTDGFLAVCDCGWEYHGPDIPLESMLCCPQCKDEWAHPERRSHRKAQWIQKWRTDGFVVFEEQMEEESCWILIHLQVPGILRRSDSCENMDRWLKVTFND